MTDDSIDDLVARTASISDAELRSPAMHAAMRAAMEDVTRMSDTPEEGGPGVERPPADSSYIASAPAVPRNGRRRVLAVAAAVALVATGAAGFAVSRTDDPTGDRQETTAATDPAPPTTAPAPDDPCAEVRDRFDAAPATDPPSTTTTIPATDPPVTTTTIIPPTTTTAPATDPSTTVPATSTSLAPGDRPGQDCAAAATDPFTMPPGRERTPPDEDEAPPADAPFAERVEFAWRVGYLGNIEHTLTTDSRNGGTTSEMWWDDSTGVWRTRSTGGTGSLHGKPELDHGAAGFDGATPKGQRQIDFCFGEYMDWDIGPLVTPETKAQRIRQDLDRGVLVEDGREVIDGRDTIRLRRTDHDERMWLDEATLLPVRTAGTWAGGGDYSTTHEFLPRTDETRQLVVPPVPEGFTKVDQVRGDGAARDAGCW